MTRVLGLDVGNGKVKACVLEWGGDWASSRIDWDSLPLPVSNDRYMDFDLGLPLRLLDFLGQRDLSIADFARVVVCCSHSFSYQPYSDSITHLGEILTRFFAGVPIALIRADGAETPLAELAHLPAQALYAYCLTNYYGSALLGSRLIRDGISLDLGTTTLDVIPIVAGAVDPAGTADPAANLRYRYGHGRIHWLGISGIPLTMLATEVPIDGLPYQVVPRTYTTDLIFGLDPADAALMRRHAYAQRFPDPATCRQQLAQFVGLDDQLLSEAEIVSVRDYLLDRLIDKVATAIAEVAGSTFGQPLHALEIASFALGQELVLRPALMRLGCDPARIRSLALGQDQALWSASSVFAMALLALEAELGTRIEIA